MIKTRVSIISKDIYLSRKIEILIKSSRDFELEKNSADIILLDIRHNTDEAAYKLEAPNGSTVLTLGQGEGDLHIPFSEEGLFLLLSNVGKQKLPTLYLGDKCAFLRGEKIKLTELEHSLLSLLISAGGEYITRDVLLSKIWGGESDGGVLNVYIHYLREKLEGAGEKIILSSRTYGYKIDEKYLKEGLY